MAKLLLGSIIVATVAIPFAMARERSAVRGLKKALVYSILFNITYLLGLLVIYPRVL
jgi:hypothetical protein